MKFPSFCCIEAKEKLKGIKIEDLLKKYKNKNYVKDDISKLVKNKIEENKNKYSNNEGYKKAFQLIDLTSLNTTDTTKKVNDMCKQVNQFNEIYKDFPNVAAICIYPNLVSEVKKSLKVPEIDIASVSACFPASMSFLDVKLQETTLAVANGANEIDIVFPVWLYKEGKKQEVFEEIAMIKHACLFARLKVILETGCYNSDYNAIREAALIAMEAGADFIKTSTGKIDKVRDFEEHIFVMCEAIIDFYEIHHKKIGIKPSGGIRTDEDAINICTLVWTTLGEEYQSNTWFRLGASTLANVLLSKVEGKEIKYFT